jgi:rod shape-determining protein MreD
LRLILLFSVFVVLGLALESAGARIVAVRSLIPNLIIILAVDLGLRHHGVLPAILAFAMGYATDALAGSHPGLNAFMMTLVFLVSYEVSTRLMVANAGVGATLVFFSVIATSLGTIAIASGFGALSSTGPILPGLTFQAFITAIIAPFIFSILAATKRLTGMKVGATRDGHVRER